MTNEGEDGDEQEPPQPPAPPPARSLWIGIGLFLGRFLDWLLIPQEARR